MRPLPALTAALLALAGCGDTAVEPLRDVPRLASGVRGHWDRYAPVVLRTPHFVFRTRAARDLDLEEPARLAEEARAELRAWLGEDPHAPTDRPVHVFLFETAEEIYHFEATLGGSWSSDPRRVAYGVAGGYYPSHHVVALELKEERSLSNDIPHEVAHAALTELSPWLPDPLHEGLATRIGNAAEEGRATLFADDTPRSPFEESALWHVTRYGELPQAESLFALDHFEYRNEDYVPFALGLALTTALLHADDVGPEGLAAIVRAYDEPLDDPYAPIRAAAPPERIAELLELEVEAMTQKLHEPPFRGARAGAFEVMTWGEVDVEALAAQVHATQEHVRHWLGVEAPDRELRIDVCVTWGDDGVAWVQRSHAAPVVGQTWRINGWRPAESERRLLLALRADFGELEWHAACLAARLTLELETPHLPTPILEGLIVHLARWCLDAEDEPFGTILFGHDTLDPLIEGLPAPSLEELFAIPTSEYHEGEFVEYAFARELVEHLAFHRDPEVRATFQRAVTAPRSAAALKEDGGLENFLRALRPVDLEELWP